MQDHTERLQLLIDELGPSTDSIVLVEQITTATWLIALDDNESAIALRLAPDTGVVTLSCELSRPQEQDRFRVYEALLTYNGLAELHGGIRMALREPNGVVIQEFDLQSQQLDLSLLRQVIEDFGRKASAWEAIIEAREPPELDARMQGTSWDALRV